MADNDYPDIPEIPELPKNIDELAQAAQESMSNLAATGVFQAFDMLTKSINRQFIEAIGSAVRVVQEYTATTLSHLAETAAALVSAVANFKLPTLTDEEAEQLVESNRIWGQYGWTYMPSMPITMFETPPASLTEANKLAMQYCTTSEMEKLFDALRKWKLNHKDLDSAIFCYQNRQYKACALLLCGLIDSKIIRVRSDEHRPTGEGAVKGIKKNYNGSGEKILAEAMFTYNLLSYLEVLFARANGFKHEPDTLNRNYIGHGMNHRAVRKRDCIQLFLALNNLMVFFDLGL